jgi:hypothetical protein
MSRPRMRGAIRDDLHTERTLPSMYSIERQDKGAVVPYVRYCPGEPGGTEERRTSFRRAPLWARTYDTGCKH